MGDVDRDYLAQVPGLRSGVSSKLHISVFLDMILLDFVRIGSSSEEDILSLVYRILME